MIIKMLVIPIKKSTAYILLYHKLDILYYWHIKIPIEFDMILDDQIIISKQFYFSDK